MSSANRDYFPDTVANAVVKLFGFVPFLVSTWAIVAWLIYRQSLAGFLSLFIVVPLLFVELALFGFVLWLRPSIRTARKLPVAEGCWYLAAIATWIAGVTVPGFTGGMLQLLAIVVSAAGLWWAAQRSRQESVDNLTARAEQMREHLRTQPGMPQSPKVTSVDEEWVVREQETAAGSHAIEAEIVEEADDDDTGPEWIARPRGE